MSPSFFPRNLLNNIFRSWTTWLKLQSDHYYSNSLYFWMKYILYPQLKITQNDLRLHCPCQYNDCLRNLFLRIYFLIGYQWAANRSILKRFVFCHDSCDSSHGTLDLTRLPEHSFYNQFTEQDLSSWCDEFPVWGLHPPHLHLLLQRKKNRKKQKKRKPAKQLDLPCRKWSYKHVQLLYSCFCRFILTFLTTTWRHISRIYVWIDTG